MEDGSGRISNNPFICSCFSWCLQEVTGEDDSDLYLEERETELKKIQEEKRRMMMAVPGMLNPHEMPEDMQDE